MRRHAKAPSAGTVSSRSKGRPGSSRRTFAVRGAFDKASGRGAPLARPAALLAIVVFALVALLAPSAFASQTREQVGTIDPSAANPGGPTPTGSFCSLAGLAVDQSGGDLYAADLCGTPLSGGGEATGALYRFDSSGKYLGTIDGSTTPQGTLSFAFPSAGAVAVDSTAGSSDGNLYVADSGHNLIDAFDSAGNLVAGFGTAGQINGAEDTLGDPDSVPTGSFNAPCGLAVDQSNGDLYVADSGHERIWIFDNGGEYLGTVADPSLSSPCGLALDSSGDLYVQDGGSGNVVRFDKHGPVDFDLAGVVYDAEGGSQPALSVVADSANGNISVSYLSFAGFRVVEYNAAGAEAGRFGEGTRTLAVDSSTHRLYASLFSELKIFGPPFFLPDVGKGTASNVGDTSATVSATVNPSGVALTDCHFDYVAAPVDEIPAAYDHSIPCATVDGTPITDPGEVPDDSADHTVSADLSGLAPSTHYHFRLVAANVDGTVEGADSGNFPSTSFTTTAPADANTFPAAGLTENTAIIGGTVDPNGLQTSYYVEYSPNPPDPDFSDAISVPATQDANAGSGVDPIVVNPRITGLSPGTTYYFRLVAHNDSGDDKGETLTFETLASLGSQPSCPNAAFRTGAAAALPECRAYEKVTPANKNGGIILPGAVIDNDHVVVKSTGSFLPNDSTFANHAYYLGDRAEGRGWRLQPSSAASKTRVTDVNRDGTKFVLTQGNCMGSGGAEDPPACPALTPDDTDHVWDIYKRGEQELQLVSKGSIGGNAAVPAFYAGQSADGDHILFETEERLEPEDVGRNPAASQLYESVDGQTRVVGILPDARCDELSLPSGCVDPEGAVLGDGAQANTRFVTPRPAGSANAVSSDGSTVFFESPDPEHGSNHQLYARINSTHTVRVSSPDCDPACEGGTKPAIFQGASEDGSRVYFTSAARLLNDDTDSDTDLYQYRVDSNELSLISHDCIAADGVPVDCNWPADLEAGNAGNVTGVSSDGRRVFFVAPPPPSGSFGGTVRQSLWMYEESSDEATFVAAGEGVGGSQRGIASFGLPAPAEEARLNKAGTALVFASDRRLTSFDNATTGHCRNAHGDLTPCAEIYRYDAQTHRLDCISCNSGAASPLGNAGISEAGSATTNSLSDIANGAHSNNLSSDDGHTVVFETGDALVPADINERVDVYEWHQGRHYLLSTGTGNADSHLSGITPDGKDIFFTTPDRLVPSDTDLQADLYDARIHGGLSADHPASAIPPCSGEACRGSAGAPFVGSTPSSNTFKGPANSKPGRPRCGQGKVRRGGRCTKKAKRRFHKQRAGGNRGGKK